VFGQHGADPWEFQPKRCTATSWVACLCALEMRVTSWRCHARHHSTNGASSTFLTRRATSITSRKRGPAGPNLRVVVPPLLALAETLCFIAKTLFTISE